MMGFSKPFAAACGLAAIANGHMLMSTPARASSPTTDNSPLESTGADYPCQLTSGATLTGDTTSMALGSDQPLEFIGQSVHGGGSCQVSITYDENPTADSTWKVITSIEGGCPARNTAGNLGDDTSATAADPYTYNFTVPDDIPSGKAVLAWTWFNKVGNREMYMNCAMVDLTGTSGSKSNYEALPDIFTANIGNGCTTANNKDVTFPDAGEVVQKLGSSEDDLAAPVGSCGSSVSISASAGISLGVTAATTAAATTAAAATETTAAGGIFASVAVSVGASEPTTTAAAAAAAATTASSSDSSSSSPSSSGSETAGSACSDEGSNVCVGSTSYLVCASGVWTSMPVAAGTACSGSGANFAIVVSRDEEFKKTRALRWVQRNLPFLG